MGTPSRSILHFGGEDFAPGRGGNALLHHRDVLRIGAERRRVPHFLPDRLVRVGVAPDLPPVVHRDDGAVGLEQDHHLQRRLEHRPELRLGRRELGGLLVTCASSSSSASLAMVMSVADTDEADQLPVRRRPAAATRCAATATPHRAACTAPRA